MTDSEKRFVERRSAHREEATEQVETSTADTESGPAEAETSLDADVAMEQEPALETEPALDTELDQLESVEVPEASFYEIVQPLEIQALQFLGEVPLTADGQRRVLPHWAKHVIDLIGIIEERTRGNLSPEEAQYLAQVLSDLRMRYVRVAT